jgi:thiol-disulfide isomerase/thioredoxin
MRIKLLSILLFAVSHYSFSQAGYKLDFKIQGLKDTTIYLGYYYGESTYVKDTAKVNALGIFTFEGKQTLPQGVYFLVLNKTKLFEGFVMGKTQRFAMETSTEDYIKNMKVTGDEDNRLFFENMMFNMERHKEAEPYLKTLRDSSLREDQKKEARVAFGKISDKVMNYQSDVIAKYPTTLTARILKSTKQIQIPEPPKRANGTIDSTFQLKYYRAHFFDNFDLADDAMIRLPGGAIYQQKLDEYLDKLFLPQADTITSEIKKLVAIAKKNPETYKYLVFSCMAKYTNPEIMGLDEVFVHVYDNYFATGEMDFWVPAATKNSYKEYADKIRLSMLGKIAPNLTMQDANLQPKSLYDIKKKYTIIFFFDPDCGHCREETPKLVDFYKKNNLKYNVEVFAVSADTSIKKMRDYIAEMKMPWITVNGPRSYTNQHYSKLYYAETTPTIYILDDKKKIIAKKPPVEKIEGFLENYEKSLKRKAIPKGS